MNFCVYREYYRTLFGFRIVNDTEHFCKQGGSTAAHTQVTSPRIRNVGLQTVFPLLHLLSLGLYPREHLNKNPVVVSGY